MKNKTSPVRVFEMHDTRLLVLHEASIFCRNFLCLSAFDHLTLFHSFLAFSVNRHKQFITDYNYKLIAIFLAEGKQIQS